MVGVVGAVVCATAMPVAANMAREVRTIRFMRGTPSVGSILSKPEPPPTLQARGRVRRVARGRAAAAHNVQGGCVLALALAEVLGGGSGLVALGAAQHLGEGLVDQPSDIDRLVA